MGKRSVTLSYIYNTSIEVDVPDEYDDNDIINYAYEEYAQLDENIDISDMETCKEYCVIE